MPGRSPVRGGAAAAACAVANRREARRSSTSDGGGPPRRLSQVATSVEVPHRVFDWINVKVGHELTPIPSEDVATEYGVPEGILVDYIDGEIKGEKDVLSLPWALLALCLFALMMLQKEDVNMLHSVEAAITYDITENANFAFSAPGYIGSKNFEDVNCHADFWSWMNKGFMPLICTNEVPVSEVSALDLGRTSPEDRWRYLWHNQRVGPLKLAKEDIKDAECVNEQIAAKFNLNCFEEANIDLNLMPTEWLVAQSTFDENVSESVWLHDFRPDGGQRQLLDLERSLWLSRGTRRIQITMLTYSGDTDLLVLTQLNFMFANSGHIWKRITHRAVSLHPYHTIAAYVFDALFYIQVTVLCLCELRDLCFALRASGMRGFREYMGIWNLVDWSFILSSYAFGAVWFYRLTQVRELNSDLLNRPLRPTTTAEEVAQQVFYSELYSKIDRIGHFMRGARLLSGILPMVILLRLFKAFAAQPRLAVVTETLRRASSDLAHYLIVFIAIYGTYAVMAVAFFGRELRQFSTMDRAFPALFRAVLGDLDYDALEAAGRQWAFFVFVTFTFMILLVMLSMLIAVIMDVYMEVKAHATRTETIWHEVSDIIRRGWMNRRKLRIPLPVIRAALQSGSRNLVDVATLVELVPHLRESQATRILRAAIDEFAAENTPEGVTDEVKNFIDQSKREMMSWLRASQTISWRAPASAGPEETRASRAVSWSKPNAEALARSLTVKDLLTLADKKVDAGEGVPQWLGSPVALQELLAVAHKHCDKVPDRISL